MIVPYNERPVALPDFFLIGAMRSGTTSVYNYLNAHHNIFMPSLKEPHFFSYLGENCSPLSDEVRKDPWNVDDYVTLFENTAPGQVIGEASPTYIYLYEKTIKNIQMIYGGQASQLKFIGILRNPIERAWSLYSLLQQGGVWSDRDFLSIARQYEDPGRKYDYYNFLTSGKYYEQVKIYQETFPLVKIFLFEELRSDSDRVIRECLDFLGISDTTIPDNVGKVYNFSGIPKNKLLSPIYKVLFGETIIKSIFKPLIPENIRTAVRTKVGRSIMKKHEMPGEVRDYLRDKFTDDIKGLKTLLSDTAQKEIVENWLQ